jgi:regulator of protease activity HflC (stomatin/prohibitin superfamily)
VIGGRELDSCLTGKDDVAQELEQQVREQATALGLEVRSVGIKDVILPGDNEGPDESGDRSQRRRREPT